MFKYQFEVEQEITCCIKAYKYTCPIYDSEWHLCGLSDSIDVSYDTLPEGCPLTKVSEEKEGQVMKDDYADVYRYGNFVVLDDEIDLTTPDPNLLKRGPSLSEEAKVFYGKSIIEQIKFENRLYDYVFVPKFKRFPRLCKKLKLGKWEVVFKVVKPQQNMSIGIRSSF